MLSKPVLTFLAIGALWVNVSAAPIPALPSSSLPSLSDHGRDSTTSSLTYDDEAPLNPNRFSYPPAPNPAHIHANYAQDDVDHNHVTLPPPPPYRPPGRVWSDKEAAGLCELPRSFSAISYRDLTCVFSVVGFGGLVGSTITYGTLYGIEKHNQQHNNTRRGFDDSGYISFLPVSKREPVSEDEGSDSLSSPLKREPEPAPPSL